MEKYTQLLFPECIKQSQKFDKLAFYQTFQGRDYYSKLVRLSVPSKSNILWARLG
jgi:hypothetical protein